MLDAASVICSAALYLASSYGVPQDRADSICENSIIIASITESHGIDPLLLLAMGFYESRWKVTAISPVNACGPLQVIPKYSKYSCKELMEIPTAVSEASRVLNKWKARKRTNDMSRLLPCYASGNACSAHSYATKIMKLHRQLKAKVSALK